MLNRLGGRVHASVADSLHRLKRAAEDVPTGYKPRALADWAARAREWAKSRDVFVYFINGAKVRAPSAAMALIELLSH